MIDITDKKIIELLQSDARIPNKEIAEKVGLVPSAISERLRKLKERKIIDSFETRIKSSKVGKDLLAFIFVRTNEPTGGWCTGSKLSEFDEIQEVHNVAGEDCYFIKVRVHDTKELSDFLREKIGRLESVESTKTTIVMDTYKETCKVKID